MKSSDSIQRQALERLTTPADRFLSAFDDQERQALEPVIERFKGNLQGIFADLLQKPEVMAPLENLYSLIDQVTQQRAEQTNAFKTGSLFEKSSKLPSLVNTALKLAVMKGVMTLFMRKCRYEAINSLPQLDRLSEEDLADFIDTLNDSKLH